MKAQLAIQLSRRASQTASFEALASTIASLVDAWPALASDLRALLTRILRDTPFSRSEALWAAFMKLRGMR